MGIDIKETAIEFAMTFLFVIAIVASKGEPIIIGAALAFAVFVGNLLGSQANHLNPAVTVALLVNGKVPSARAAALVFSQLVAAALAVLAVKLTLGDAVTKDVASSIKRKSGMDFSRS